MGFAAPMLQAHRFGKVQPLSEQGAELLDQGSV
jgi:hypothetical protein